MPRTRTTVSALILLSFSTSILSAHEGHGHTSGQGHTPSHYLTEPIHLLQIGTLLLAFMALAYFAFKWLHQTTSHRPGNLA